MKKYVSFLMFALVLGLLNSNITNLNFANAQHPGKVDGGSNSMAIGESDFNESTSPVISKIRGPQSLKVNQQGTWTVKASSSTGGSLSYSVNWGDEYSYYLYNNENLDAANTMSAPQQSATFTHIYTKAGVYTPTFTVISQNNINCITAPCPSNKGKTQASITVKVGKEIKQAPTISYLSPNYSQVNSQVTIYGSGFAATGNKVKFGDLGSENNPSYSLNSSDGRTLVFTVPSSNYVACWYSTPACYIAARITQPGTYAVSVTNVRGTSNVVNFTVTNRRHSLQQCEYANPPVGYHYEGMQPYPECGGYLVKDDFNAYEEQAAGEVQLQ